MPVIDYDATLVALTMPGERDTLLGSAGFTAADVDAVCAECARLAYCGFERTAREKQRLDAALALVDMPPAVPIVDNGTDTQAFGSMLPDGRRLVAFRGTQPDRIKDLVTDGKATMVPWGEAAAGQVVHHGFAEAFRAIEPAVASFLDGCDHPVFTGHSLGAALATLAASRFPGATLLTLGSPRVGNQAFVDHVLATSRAQVRHVDCCDLITTLPPPFPGFYVHCGEERYIDRDGVVQPGIGQIDKAIDQFHGQADYAVRYAARHGDVPLRGFADHAPINYVRAFS